MVGRLTAVNPPVRCICYLCHTEEHFDRPAEYVYWNGKLRRFVCLRHLIMLHGGVYYECEKAL